MGEEMETAKKQQGQGEQGHPHQDARHFLQKGAAVDRPQCLGNNKETNVENWPWRGTPVGTV